MAAFRAALELGVDGIEFDVRTCKSGEVVVFHDPTLNRMTDGRGFVKSKTLAELKGFRIKTDNPLLDERIPTLEQLIEAVRGRARMNVEIKTKGLPRDHVEEKVVEILRHYRVEQETVVSSFNPIVLRRIRKIDSQIVTGYLLDKNFTFRNSEIPLSRLAGAQAIHFEKTLLNQKLLAKVREMNIYSAVWTVNDPLQMQQFLNMGVHVIITDRPDLLMKESKSKGHHV